MSLSSLTMCQGILESEAPDLDPHAVAILAVSTWDAGYYTLSGSDVTALANPGSGAAWTTFGWATADLVTDGDGTKWFADPLDGILNAETMIPAAADLAVISALSEGVITLESYRAKADQSNSYSALEGAGWDMTLGNPSKAFWRNLRTHTSGTSRDDLEHYRQVVAGLFPAPYAATTIFAGAFKDELLGAGVYNPNGNVFSAADYDQDDDIVMSWFYQPGGLRCMVNGQFVTLRVANYYNTDGTIASAPDNAAVLALDWTPKAMHANGGGTGSIGTIRPNLAAATKTDFMGLLPGSRLDSEVAALHAKLLSQKPT